MKNRPVSIIKYLPVVVVQRFLLCGACGRHKKSCGSFLQMFNNQSGIQFIARKRLIALRTWVFSAATESISTFRTQPALHWDSPGFFNFPTTKYWVILILLVHTPGGILILQFNALDSHSRRDSDVAIECFGFSQIQCIDPKN